MKLEKDYWSPIEQLMKELQNTKGILITDVKRDGENFELTFDRDLTLENLAQIKTLVNTFFPNHKIIEKKEELLV
jgi:hypothetical protein